jgi:cardiolipin synthase
MGDAVAILLDSWHWILTALELLALASIPSILLQRRGRPLSALSWVMAMVTLPAIGLGLWWLIGRNHLRRKKRKRRKARETLAPRIESLSERLHRPGRDQNPLVPLTRLPRDVRNTTFPPTSGNRVELLVDGQAVYAAMKEAIARAEHHVHFLFYIWDDDRTGREFRDLLCERARSGVQVRALYDAVGSLQGRKLAAPLRRCGGQVASCLPPRLFTLKPNLNFRNHRKILVVDGRVGFIGGLNIGDGYIGDWHDVAVCVQGPALDQLQEIFVDDWFHASGQNLASEEYFGKWDAPGTAAGEVGDAGCAVVATGPDNPHNLIHDLLFATMNQARERLFITTPYFIPSPSILTAIRTAVYRGVDVRLLLPAQSDVPVVQMASRSYYLDILKAGGAIYEYQPAFLHAKTIVFDDELSLVGSANIDTRSFRFNFEANMFVRDRALNSSLSELFERNQSQSVAVRIAQLEARPWSSRVGEAAVQLLSPLL